MADTLCSTKNGGRAGRRISFKNVFRRSSTANAKTSTTTGGKGNTSFHSHGTDVTADSLASGSSSVASSSSVAQAPAAEGSVRGDAANISDRRTTASASDHSATTNDHHQTRPRRSSLKKTSNYEPMTKLSLIGSTDDDDTKHKLEQQTQPKSNIPFPANGTKRRPSLRRRRSTTDIPSTGGSKVLLPSSSSSSTNSLNRRQSVQFDSCVSFATVPSIDDIKKQGGCETDLYYTDEEFGQMKRAVRQDARQIKEDRMNVTNDNHGNETSISTNTNSQTCHEPSYQQRQNEDDLNDWGIEHHTCTKSARAARAHRVNHVIQLVLREQETQCIDPDSGLLTEASVRSLARTSARASQAARVQAQRRASDVERHCRRWSDTARNTNASANISDNDIGKKMKREEGKQRRHSSCEVVLPHHGDFREDGSDDGGSNENDVLSVADASLDESAPSVKSYWQRCPGGE